MPFELLHANADAIKEIARDNIIENIKDHKDHYYTAETTYGIDNAFKKFKDKLHILNLCSKEVRGYAYD